MACSAEKIAEKKREAMERLKRTKETLQAPKQAVNANNSTSRGTAPKPSVQFYGNQNPDKAIALNQYEFKMNNQVPHSSSNRVFSQPYPRSNQNPNKTAPSNQKVASVFNKMVTCTCQMISHKRFEVKESRYYAKLIDVFKSIPTRSYDREKKIWSFDLSVYDEVQRKVSALNPDVAIGSLPPFVLKLLREEENELDLTCIQAIEKKIASQLLDFQKYGVAFAIRNKGRCMIADDMGLGKTYQAIAVADFYKDDWPLLVVTTATARSGWVDHFRKLLPWVPADSIKCLEKSSDYIGDCKVLITSYSLLQKSVDILENKRFGFIILDESHTIKNVKTISAQVATRLCKNAKRIILLTGTPALSRPSELHCQLNLIDGNFFGSFRNYSRRYCDGKESTFGWDSSGSSNLKELNVILQHKFMIRRTKEEVQFELGEKSRETIFLDSGKVWNSNDESMRETIENCKEFCADIQKMKGNDRKEILLRLYAESAKLKANAVCSYVRELVKTKNKFIIFGYHMVMLNALSACLKQLNVNFVRIDGTTKNELRSTYIDRFQEDKTCQVAVLSLKACNAAITLTAASLVVFTELDWNPSTLAQCEARAHRIGQESPVTCRYLLAKGTVDDYMWNMVKEKQDVLSKAGIFSEDLTDATHSTVSVRPSTSKLTNYFQRSDGAAIDDCGNNNQNAQADQNASVLNTSESMDYKHMLDGDEDDFAMLDMDF